MIKMIKDFFGGFKRPAKRQPTSVTSEHVLKPATKRSARKKLKLTMRTQHNIVSINDFTWDKLYALAGHPDPTWTKGHLWKICINRGLIKTFKASHASRKEKKHDT